MTMHRAAISIICTLALVGLAAIAAAAQTAPPEFSGVYYPFQQGRGGGGGGAPAAAPAGQRAGPPPAPTRSAPTGDLSNGRSPTAPSLTPEYMAKWEIIRKSRM